MILSRSWRLYLPWLIGILGSLVFLAIAEKPWTDGLDTTKAVKDSIRTHSWAVIGLWWGAAINAAICLVVLAILFLRRKHEPTLSPSLPSADEPNPPSKRARTSFSIAIFAMAVLGAVMMFPRLDLSLWGDEEATTRRYIIGHVYRVGDNQDEFVLKAPNWEKTLFNWEQGPSNQVMFSALARLAHGPGDISPDDPGEFYFTEWKIRLPSYIAGIGAILSTCWLVWLLGAPRGAFIAGFLMAMHPLILRYSTEARGYALLLFFGPLAVCFLIKALQTTRLRWWLPFGITQFFLLWSYFGSVYLLMPLNVVAICLAWDVKQYRNPLNSGQVWRYAGSTLLGAMLTIQIMMPNLLQLPGFLEGGRLEGSIDGAWMQDSVSFWLSGLPWHDWEVGNPNSITLGEVLDRHAFVPLWVTFFLTTLVAGIVLLLRKKQWRWFTIVLAAPAVMMVAHAYVAGNLLYPWYTVGFIPLGMVFIACTWGKLLDTLFRYEGKKLLMVSIPIILILPMVFYWSDLGKARQNIRHNSIEPLAGSTRHYRDVVNPFHPDIDKVKSISFHHYSRLYDPVGQVAKSDEEFIQFLKDNDTPDGKPLWINTAHIPFGKLFFPKAFALLENPEVFEPPVVFWGMQQPCTRSVFKYKPGGLARAGIE